jgi:hypothetical protein
MKELLKNLLKFLSFHLFNFKFLCKGEVRSKLLNLKLEIFLKSCVSLNVSNRKIFGSPMQNHSEEDKFGVKLKIYPSMGLIHNPASGGLQFNSNSATI